MTAEDNTDMVAGIPRDEYLVMLDDSEAMEECAARMCPEGYAIGLEIGTIAARAAGLHGEPDFDREKWDENHDPDPEGRGWQLLNETAAKEDSPAWEWAVRAIAFGIEAGHRQPMRDHEAEEAKEGAK